MSNNSWLRIVISVLCSLICSSQVAQERKFETDIFLYGASVYPGILTEEEQIRMFDLFSKSRFTVFFGYTWTKYDRSPGNK
jgi:hypothetical protein